MANLLPQDLQNSSGNVIAETDIFLVQQGGNQFVSKLDYTTLLSGAVRRYEMGVANGVCTLDANTLIPTQFLPALAISDVYVVADTTERDALTVQSGDVAKVVDSDGSNRPQTYIWSDIQSAWIDFQETSDVISVNGYTGVVSLVTADIASSTDKRYLTDAELVNVQLIGTADHNWLTDDELLSLQEIGGTDKNLLTDVELTKLQALEGTDKRTVTDAELAKITRLDNQSSLTSGANVSVDLSLGQTFDVVADQDFTLDFASNVVAGQSGFISITQDATGSRVMTLDAGYVTASGAGITLTTTADAVDVLEYKAISTSVIVLSLIADVK